MNKLDNLKLLQVELWSEYKYSEASYAPKWITETPFTRENIKLLAEIVDDAIIRMRKTPTNFDKVTASPEALAEFVYSVQGLAIHRYDTIYPWCMVVISSGKTCPANCTNCITEWLKQEAKEIEE